MKYINILKYISQGEKFMKKITAIIMMVLFVTIGGVYATWTYSETAMGTASRDAINIALTTANNKGGSVGSYEFSNAVEVAIDDDQTDNTVHKAVLTCTGSITLTFTPSATAGGDIKELGIAMKITPSINTATWKDAEGVDTKIISIASGKTSFLSPVLTEGNESVDAKTTAETNDLGVFAKTTDGKFTWTLDSSDILSILVLFEGKDLILDSSAAHAAFGNALAGHKIITFSVEQVV
jgi:hypothetical protein